MKNMNIETPLKTRMAFNVGVIGHRSLPEANLDLLKSRIDDILMEIEKNISQLMVEVSHLHTEDPPYLHIISMLAEGSDRIVTECGLRRGYRLQCPLPMKREEYEKDFEAASSRDEFHRLLNQAESVLEIESCTGVRSRAYQDCGHVILGQSDLVIAIWDGRDSGKVGGTSDMIGHAIQNDIPVIWIKSSAEHDISFLYGQESESAWPVKLKEAIRHILVPWDMNKKGKLLPENYMKENLGKKSHAKLYMYLTKMLSWTPLKKEEAVLQEESEDEFYIRHYLPHLKCVDNLAKYYRDIYRSAGILRQLLPFLASIGLALGFYSSLFGGPNGTSPDKANVLNTVSNIGFLLQAVCFLLIILLSKIEKKFHWHQKFTDYRALCELLRQMRYLAPEGLVIRGLRVSAFNPSVNISWVNWQFRAILREAGLPSCLINEKLLQKHAAHLNNCIIKEQINYHDENKDKMQLITKRLESFGMAIYYVGIFILVLRVVVHIITTGTMFPQLTSGQKGYISTFFNMLSMVVPLFSAVSFGISSQEGFERIGQLSKGMREKLINISQRIAGTRSFDFNIYKTISQHIADLMLSEFSDWNMFIKSKSITDH